MDDEHDRRRYRRRWHSNPVEAVTSTQRANLRLALHDENNSTVPLIPQPLWLVRLADSPLALGEGVNGE